MNKEIRNIGIIAHVDHGKTTLVDRLLQEAGIYRENETVQDRAMDSMDLEREKGITIKSKNAAVSWQDIKVNIVDTPGHADFGGEVERILNMVDGVLLLVDAADGPQAQTRFVLRKALENNLQLIVFINKIDRDQAQPARIHDLVLELLLELDASEDQFNAPFLYGSARDGFVMKEVDAPREGMEILLDAIVEHVPPPQAKLDAYFQMLVSNLDWNDYVGRIAIGSISQGEIRSGDSIVCKHIDGSSETGKISRLYSFSGLGMQETDEVSAGDIAGIAGFDSVFIGETLCDSAERPALPIVKVDPPTIQMEFCVNNGPLGGRDGKYVTSRQIGERLVREQRMNISIQCEEKTDQAGTFIVSARGELQIAVLVETMRREGFELLVSRPSVIFHREDGELQEPYELLWIDMPQEALGDVMQNLASRKGRVTHMEHAGTRDRLEVEIPTRGLIGFEGFLTSLTSGEGITSHMFHEYRPHCGPIPSRSTGSLVATGPGTSTAYALDTIQARGKLFIGPTEEVYEGMVVGENARTEDLPVNPTKTKQLTNVRASGSDKAIMLEPPLKMSLERCLEFIADDEFVEATPNHLRMRKKILGATARKRAS